MLDEEGQTVVMTMSKMPTFSIFPFDNPYTALTPNILVLSTLEG